MSITVPRFEAKKLEEGRRIITRNEKSVGIKDHSSDKFVVMIDFGENYQTNVELAEQIIETIENYISEKDVGED